MSINQAFISGHLTRDADYRETKSGSGYLTFSVAVNERRKSASGEWEDYPNYIDCTLFGGLAERIAQQMRKGTKVALSGRLHQNRWKDADKGTTQSKLGITVDQLEILPKPQNAVVRQAEPMPYDDLPF